MAAQNVMCAMRVPVMRMATPKFVWDKTARFCTIGMEVRVG